MIVDNLFFVSVELVIFTGTYFSVLGDSVTFLLATVGGAAVVVRLLYGFLVVGLYLSP